MRKPDFDVAFSIGGFTIYWYAVLLALGIAAAMLITDRRAKGRDVPKDIALDACIVGIPFGTLGARVFACLSGAVSWNDFFDLTRSGLSFFGGVAFAALAILVYLKLRKANLGEFLDMAAPGTFAGIGIAAWGDFFNRTHYGPLVEKASHKWFPLATVGNDLQIHYAAFFYEFLLCIVLIVLYYMLLRKVVRDTAMRFWIMSLIYLMGRFCIDGIRQDMVMVEGLAFDQVCEICLGMLCMIPIRIKRKPILLRWLSKMHKTRSTSRERVIQAKYDHSQDKALQESDHEPEREDTFTGLN